MTQLLANLLDHAVRFATRGGEIRIRTQPVFWDRRAGNLSEGRPAPDRRLRRASEANAYRIEVQDPGPAIRQSSTEGGDGADKEAAEGTQAAADFGFGLAMCSQIIELHRGRIVTDGIEPGYFACDIPYAQEADADARNLRVQMSAPLGAMVS